MPAGDFAVGKIGKEVVIWQKKTLIGVILVLVM